MSEYGVIAPQGKDKLRELLPLIINCPDNELTVKARQYLNELLSEWRVLDSHIKRDDKEINIHAENNDPITRLKEVRGIGSQTASALFAYAGDGSGYKNGRQFSASLGLVPREHSSGGKQRLGGITKRGNAYIRTLLTQCAWSIIRYSVNSEDRLSVWVRSLVERRGVHKAALAIANKLARMVWSMLFHQTTYKRD